MGRTNSSITIMVCYRCGKIECGGRYMVKWTEDMQVDGNVSGMGT